MVFLLKSFVHERTPMHTYTCESPCYELLTQEIEIPNPFPQDATFLISDSQQLPSKKPARAGRVSIHTFSLSSSIFFMLSLLLS